MIMKPGKHERGKQYWKVHNHVQSFVLHLYTMQELPNQNNSIGYFLSTEQTTTIVLAHSQGRKKGTKTDNKEICLLS